VANKTGDHAPNGCSRSDCTLREAVIKANDHAGKDTILLKRATYTMELAPSGSNGADSGDLNITDPVAIKHTGAGRATIDANGLDRAFQLLTGDSDRYTKFTKVVIRGGSAAVGGGIMIGSGSCGLVKSVVTHNHAGGDGGGIFVFSGELTLTRTTVSGNTADGQAGGILTYGETVITGSTISGNEADSDLAGGGGGGIRAYGGPLKMRNDTVADNDAFGSGGGILSSGTASLNNVTVARNMADSNNSGGSNVGGGIYVVSGVFTIGNSLIALNSVGSTGSAPDCRGTFDSAGHNLVSHITIGCDGFVAAGDLSDPDPKIGQLANNGGSTKTIALLSGSPAIGAADPTTAETRDQRGHLRDSHPDIGAFER
jgi:hypothetical protein